MAAGNYNITELSKSLSGKQVSVQPYISERSQGVNGGAEPKDLETAMKLMFAYLTEPRKDVNQFQSIIQRSKANLSNRGSEPGTVFKDSVNALLGNYNIRRTPPTLAKLEEINLDRAYQIYKERFADASGTTFTFVGAIDMETIKPLLEKYLASLPATNSGQLAKDLGIRPAKGPYRKEYLQGYGTKGHGRTIFYRRFQLQ